MPLSLHPMHCIIFVFLHVCELSEGSDRDLNISKSSILATELTQKRHSNTCRLMGGNLWEYRIYFEKPNKGSRHF